MVVDATHIYGDVVASGDMLDDHCAISEDSFDALYAHVILALKVEVVATIILAINVVCTLRDYVILKSKYRSRSSLSKNMAKFVELKATPVTLFQNSGSSPVGITHTLSRSLRKHMS